MPGFHLILTSLKLIVLADLLVMLENRPVPVAPALGLQAYVVLWASMWVMRI